MGGESAPSLGALVPTVKTSSEAENAGGIVEQQEQVEEEEEAVAAEEEDRKEDDEEAMTAATTATVSVELDKDMLCPICMEMIKDAFLTSCGHSFCYMCIVTHLQNKSDCPCCHHFLTPSHLYPNFLLNKLLKKTSARQIAKNATPMEQLLQALKQGYEVSIKELDTLVSLLAEKKRKLEQEEAETNMLIMLDFLNCLKNQKLDELNELQTDLQYIKEDINAVERRRIDMYRSRDRYLSNLGMLGDDPRAKAARSSLIEKLGGRSMIPSFPGQRSQCRMGSTTPHIWKADERTHSGLQTTQRKDVYSDSQQLSQSGLIAARKKRIHAQFNDLQDSYLQKRRYWARQSPKTSERDSHRREGFSAGLEDFQSVLSTFTRYSRLRVVAELRHGDLFHSANIVSSIEFDRDDELFATAGVSRRIKVFEFSSVVNEPADIPCPVAEMSTRSKLSCLSWNKYTKNHIASSDYEGIVTVWDVTTHQSVMEYEEHEKRAWSVDFSRTEPSMLVSGSDDCKVKIWCTKQEASVLNIDMKANICSVKYNPGSSVNIAVGSADHHIHYYDLRNTSQPVHIFSGHRKAVSYVKFLSSTELASASTDSTLRLWDVKENVPVRTFRGHTNEKNFVGLTVNSEYIACGSETNEVFVYHKAIPKPAACHKFGRDGEEGDEDAGSYFISAVCWKSDSPTMLTANSQGTIKVLVLAS
ncbi:OLC1v1020781C2 [Oldenlandia corymbosa var. corymbosa]|uniref:OLC1v1020781C2 n=1 Tax=Oldenlandia corymbosa var. corymbosa TaxID=529605 RepID=A0AAV1BU87_OLDCO|nr:OLC1v1020781C2 [Oldenlandia corymbosa var. corymbosa]